jgi:signal transduction histidine kinase/ActR/RegA family two-component response regulator
MQHFRDISIKRKLTFIIMLTSIVTLLLAAAAFVTYDLITLRDAMVDDVSMLTQIIAANSTADLVFNDQKSAEENLATLRANPHVESSCIYTKEGKVFASYFRHGMAAKLSLPPPQEDGYHFGSDCLIRFRHIYLNKKPVGVVYVRYDLRELHLRALRYAVIAVIILLTASFVALLLSSRLQRVISKPLLDLAETANMISCNKNYSVRAEKHGQDEIGILIDGFNEMLSQIQERDTKLEHHSGQLEKQVASRTAELEKANEDLTAQIAAKQKIEEELFRTRQLESLGVLAGGIAHDFNNLLTAILGNISLAKLVADPSDKMFARLEDAEKASVRARDLTQQLLTFSKGGAPIKKVTSIADVIKDSARFALRGSKTRCELTVPDDLWPVEVDEGQISQVINNLVINADQAMPEGGEVNICAGNLVLNERRRVSLPLGRYIRISVKDSGMGIPKDHLSKIFTPYFSTKQRGSGLGLATSYSIVGKHNGLITVESELGTGTTFHIYLPATEKETLKKEKETNTMSNGKGKILIMDDEEMVRCATGEMLSHIGYKVEFANDGAEAIRLYKKAKESEGLCYDMVILDLTVPGGTGGKETVRKLLEIDPNVKAVASSGYANGSIMAEFKKYGFKGVIAKPYRIDELYDVVNRVINEDE